MRVNLKLAFCKCLNEVETSMTSCTETTSASEKPSTAIGVRNLSARGPEIALSDIHSLEYFKDKQIRHFKNNRFCFA